MEVNIFSISDRNLPLFSYDPDSVMVYDITAGATRQLCDYTKPCFLKDHDKNALELSKGDKAKAANFYPKPADGYISLPLDGSRQQHSVSFSQPQYSFPRIVLGISSLEWDPWASCDATLELTKTHIEGDGFFFGASRGRDGIQGGLTGSWLSIDPLIHDICVAPQESRVSVGDLTDEWHLPFERLAGQTYEEPSIIIWIKGLTLRHNSIHAGGA